VIGASPGLFTRAQTSSAISTLPLSRARRTSKQSLPRVRPVPHHRPQPRPQPRPHYVCILAFQILSLHDPPDALTFREASYLYLLLHGPGPGHGHDVFGGRGHPRGVRLHGPGPGLSPFGIARCRRWDLLGSFSRCCWSWSTSFTRRTRHTRCTRRPI